MREYFYRKCPLDSCIQVTDLRTCFIRAMEPGYMSQGEYHNFWEIILVLEGEITIATDKTVYVVQNNSMALLTPMEIHWVSNASAQEAGALILSFGGELPDAAGHAIYVLMPDTVHQFSSLVRLIRENFRMETISVIAPKEDHPFIVQEVRSRLELLLTCMLSGRSVRPQTISADYKRIVDYLNSHLHEKLTLYEIAQALSMSVSNMKKVFSKYSDVGVIAYFNRCKLNRAVSLLEQGMSVRTVSDTLGYSSQSAFCTAFKNSFGVPPSRM